MKQRHGFVSNSSSSSFIMVRDTHWTWLTGYISKFRNWLAGMIETKQRKQSRENLESLVEFLEKEERLRNSEAEAYNEEA